MESGYKIPDWLKNLQENSWELELLISGGAIFSLFKASGIFLDSITYLRMTTAVPLSVFYIVGIFGLKLLTFGFILHLILRSFWVAMVFVNFVFPKGINESKIKYKRPFKANISESNDLFKPIMKIDKLAGLIMFLSITYSIVIVGLILVLIFVLQIVQNLPIDFLKYFIGISFLVYLFDLFSFGLLRKIKYISYVFYPIFKFFDFLSLRFIYKKPLFVYSTNINKVKTTLFIIVFMIVVLLSTYVTVQKPLHFPNILDNREYRGQLADNISIYDYYVDENSNSRIKIPSKIIENNFLELTIEYWAIENRFMKIYDKPENEKYYSDIFEVRIDDAIYTDLEWFPYWENESNKLGVKAMISIEDLADGKHVITVQHTKEISKIAESSGFGSYISEIPFWKDTH